MPAPAAGWRLPLVILGAVFDLNGPAHYVHWHFFQMSVANLIVIGLMIVVFILAILLPFPKREIEE
jgi:uncharacterized membrane protein